MGFGLECIADGCVPDNRMLQPAMLRLRPDEQPDCDRGGYLPDIFLRRRSVRHNHIDLEGKITLPHKSTSVSFMNLLLHLISNSF